MRWRWLLLGLWAAIWLLARPDVAGDWAFFQEGARLLRGPHPLSLYAQAPQLQIGPLALLAGVPLAGANRLLVQGLLCILGLAALRAVELTWPARRPFHLLLAGLLFLPAWAFVVTSGHLDDALVLLFLALAGLAVSRDRAMAAGVLTGAAMAAKPWAVVLLPIVWGLRTGRLRALIVAAALMAAAWAPFFIGDSRTAAALSSFRINVSAVSGLRLLGYDGGPAPSWVRPAQILLGLALAVAVARKGRWWAVPAVGLALRVALDAGAMGYYLAGPALAALLIDGWSPRRIPIGSLAVFGGLFCPAYLNLLAARHGIALNAAASGRLVAGLRVSACALLGWLAVAGSGARTERVRARASAAY